MVVGPQEVERRVEQPRLLEADEDGVGAVAGTQAAGAQAGLGLPGVLERVGDADLLRFPPAALEDPQDVAGLRGLEPRQRVEERHDALSRLSRRESAGARSGAAVVRRSCCSSRRSGPT